jgi:NADH-quinone oxidoreductase subunit J
MPPSHVSLAQWILGIILILSAIGVVSLRKPIYASLSFLLSLIVLAIFYLQLAAEFIAVMQILVYAGAILVIFVFVIVLFQDAHQQLARFKPQSQPYFLIISGIAFIVVLIFFGGQIVHLANFSQTVPKEFGSVHGIGQALYLDFFFPFEAVILLFLVAIVGALYIAKKER